jgi:hypothetical protein
MRTRPQLSKTRVLEIYYNLVNFLGMQSIKHTCAVSSQHKDSNQSCRYVVGRLREKSTVFDEAAQSAVPIPSPKHNREIQALLFMFIGK